MRVSLTQKWPDASVRMGSPEAAIHSERRRERAVDAREHRE
jgi:hypothetical protein